MKTRDVLLLAGAVAAVLWLTRRARAASGPRLLRPSWLDEGSVISNTGGASQGMILPDARAAQEQTDRYGYASGS